MSRPVQHPKTGTYYFRKAVPDDLRVILGKVEEKRSLGTKDPAEAKVRHAAMAAEVEKRWQGLRAGPQRLTQKQAVALAGRVYRAFVDRFDDDPGSPEQWADLRRSLAQARAGEHPLRLPTRGGDGKADPLRLLHQQLGPLIQVILLAEGLVIDDASHRLLLIAVTDAMEQAHEVNHRKARGDYSPDPKSDRFPEWTRPEAVSKARGERVVTVKPKTTMTGLVQDWWREASLIGAKASTLDSYQRSMGKLVAFLKHDDARRVTDEDVIRFKDARLAEINPKTGKPVSAKTVKDSDLAGLKSVFGWAVQNKRLPSNPAQSVTLKIGKQRVLRPKAFTEAEAKALLKAAIARKPGREHPKMAAAKRWVPWLCAYTGARVGEMAQLRKQDVRQEEGFWVLRITPEAGTVKTDEARDVVIHSHLIDVGFLDFVQASPGGHLFLDLGRGGKVAGRLNTLTNRLSEEARETVTDPNVMPNHGWRHRFKSVGIDAGVDARVLDVMQGHAPRTVGERYGHVSIKAMGQAMAIIPRIDVG